MLPELRKISWPLVIVWEIGYRSDGARVEREGKKTRIGIFMSHSCGKDNRSLWIWVRSIIIRHTTFECPYLVNPPSLGKLTSSKLIIFLVVKAWASLEIQMTLVENGDSWAAARSKGSNSFVNTKWPTTFVPFIASAYFGRGEYPLHFKSLLRLCVFRGIHQSTNR